MKASVSVEGLSSLLDKLEDVDEAAICAAVASGMQAGLEAAAGEAAALCPKDTGALAASIGIKADGRSATLYAASPYAVHVEMGTRYQSARPFLYPALQANRAKIVQGASSAVRSLIREGEMRKQKASQKTGQKEGVKRADSQRSRSNLQKA